MLPEMTQEQYYNMLINTLDDYQGSFEHVYSGVVYTIGGYKVSIISFVDYLEDVVFDARAIDGDKPLFGATDEQLLNWDSEEDIPETREIRKLTFKWLIEYCDNAYNLKQKGE